MTDLNAQIAQRKRELRLHFRMVRDGLDRHPERSAAIRLHLVRIEAVRMAQTLHTFLPFGSEPDIYPFLERVLAQNRKLVVPVAIPGAEQLTHSLLESLEEDQLVSGRYGIPQPRVTQAVKQPIWDVILIPLLAFDREGYRLGYGSGYYDRFLVDRNNTLTIGIGFTALQLHELPRAAHDIPLDMIVTEDGVVFKKP